MVWGDTIEKLEDCSGDNHGRSLLISKSKSKWRGKHTDRTKARVDWPHHLDTMHQMMNFRDLKQALDRGMRLLVVPAVNNMFLAHVVRKKDPHVPLNDMDNVRLQIKVAHAFAKKHKWYCIARDPWQASEIIKSGRMAVILSVEVSHLMPDTHGCWIDQLDELYDLGVRSMQIVHETDSRFAGAAFHHGLLFRVMHVLKDTSKGISDAVKANPLILTQAEALKATAMYESMTSISKKAPIIRKENPNGLTKEGKKLILEMIKRNMIIEIDHCSRTARKDVFNFLGKRNTKQFAYPVNFSHARFDSLMPSKKQVKKELGKDPDLLGHPPGWDSRKTTGEYMPTDDEFRKMRETGGIFGIRTGPNVQRTHEGCPVANTCHTSSRSLAQIISKGADMGLAMSLGTDILMPLVGARFEGDGKWQKAASGVTNHKQMADKLNDRRCPPVKWNDKLSEFNFDGLKHVGLEPDLLQDLENLGLDVGDLKDNSAEFILRMWERCHDDKRDLLSEAAYREYYGVKIPPGAKATKRKRKHS
jgi:microsomal dipeptidase-like Zn-dependent dipeptidase